MGSPRGRIVKRNDNTSFDTAPMPEAEAKKEEAEGNVQNNASAQDKPTLNEDKLAKAKVSLSPDAKTALGRQDDKVDGYTFLSAVLGTPANKLHEVQGEGSRLKALAAMGDNSKRVGEILPGQVAYDIIKAAATGSDLKPQMAADTVSKDSDGIKFTNDTDGKLMKFGGAEYAMVTSNHSGASNTTDVPNALQTQYNAFVKALDDVILWNAKGEAIEFNVENKADFQSELLAGGDPKGVGAMQSVIRSAYKTAVDSFVDQLKSKTAKEKLFLPVLTSKDDKNTQLANQPTDDIKGFAPGSNVNGIQGTGTGSPGFALRLIYIKKGAKRSILDTSSGMMAYDATKNPSGLTDGANPKLSAFITESGMKVFKKAVELYYSQEVDKDAAFSM